MGVDYQAQFKLEFLCTENVSVLHSMHVNALLRTRVRTCAGACRWRQGRVERG